MSYCDQCAKLISENESLKAKLRQVDDVLVVDWIVAEDGDYRKALHQLVTHEIAIHDDPAVSEVAAKRGAERDELLEVVREYRESHWRYNRSSIDACYKVPGGKIHSDFRCPTCIKADALLSRDTKKEK